MVQGTVAIRILTLLSKEKERAGETTPAAIARDAATSIYRLQREADTYKKLWSRLRSDLAQLGADSSTKVPGYACISETLCYMDKLETAAVAAGLVPDGQVLIYTEDQAQAIVDQYIAGQEGDGVK
jgi:hypothetical protein